MKYFNIIIFMFASFILQAQRSDTLETVGTDFYFTFMPNAHNDDRPHSKDSLHIYITSKTPTKGKIYYNEVANNIVTSKEIDFEITKPNEVYHHSLQYFYVALRGKYNNLYNFNLDFDDERVSKKSFHITTEAKSTVYVLDYAQTTAEACIVLPTHTLGKEYYIMSFNSSVFTSSINSTPSQFAIVGVKDNTTIQIEPSSPTHNNGLATQTITLNQGEVYLVQNKVRQYDNDMTGSHIVADKEIAVFSGHQRSAIHVNQGDNPSRDCLIEQMLPVSVWGKNAIITPFAGNRTTGDYIDIFRVVAARNNTNIYVDGKLVTTLNKGEYYQDTLKVAVISSNNPIMVASFMKTENSDETSNFGDPSMLIVPPVEQYKNSHTVINAPFTLVDYYGVSHNVFVEQYLNIVAPIEAIEAGIYIDGNLFSDHIFTPIGNTGYSYVNYRTKDGTHNINSTFPISVIVYGYGEAVSYGYLGAMVLDIIEDVSLKINSNDSCLQSFNVTYIEPFHSGIKSFEIVDSTNCRLTMIRKTQWKIIWELEKRDNTKDAIITIKITDIYGKDSTYSDTIRTKAIAINNNNYNIIDFGKIKLGNIDSTKINIINIGTYPIILTDKNFKLNSNTNFTISKSVFPININSGDTVTIKIYYNPTKIDKKNIFDNDTLIISNECFTNILPLIGEPVPDTLEMNSICNVPLVAVADSINVPTIIPNLVTNGIISYNFPMHSDENVSIKIFDIKGEKIYADIFTGYLPKGIYEIMIDANNFDTGIYFIILKTEKYNYSNKLFIEK